MRGSIVKRGSTYSIVFDLPSDPETGKRRQKWQSGFRTKKAAEAALTEALRGLDTNMYVEPAKISVAEFLRDWLVATKPTVKHSTYETYVAQVNNHIIPNIGSTKLQALTATSLNKFYARLLAEGKRNGTGGLSPKTVRNIHVLLHKALEDAVRWSHLAKNVAEYADPPRSRPPTSEGVPFDTWSAGEVATFLEFIRDHRFHTPLLVAATTGMRRGEVLGLRWTDIDFERSRISVRRSLVSVNYKLSFSDPKTPRSRRSIPIDDITLQTLKAHKRMQTEKRLAFEGQYQDQDLVFAKDDGSPIHPDSFTKTFSALVKKSGLSRIRLHDLRHTYATLSLQVGIHPKIVSERLGHASVSITLDIYSHAVPGLQEQAADKVARLLFS